MSRVKKAGPSTASAAKSAPSAVPAKKASPPAPAKATPKRAKPLAQAKPQPPAVAPKVAKAGKPRQKPVRDSFTMPESDFALIATLKTRLLAAKRVAKKSELLRAGLHALAALGTPALVAALGKLDPVKVGRPSKGH